MKKDDTREWLQTFMVRVKKASKPTYWYAKHIGEVFEVFYTRKASAALNGMVQVYEQQQLSIHEGDYEKMD